MPKPISLIVNQTIGAMHHDIVTASRDRQTVKIFNGIAYKRISICSRLITWLLFSFQLLWHLLHKGSSYSSLLVVSNPPFAPLLAPFARRPYCLLLYDLYPQVLDQLQSSHLPQRLLLDLVKRFWHATNKCVFSNAHCLFTLSSSMADQLKPYFPNESLWRKHVLVIPPWADTKIMYRSVKKAHSFRHQYSVEGLLLTYSGNLGLTHPLEILLDTGARLEGLWSSPRAQIFLIGKGPKLDTLLHHANELQIPQDRVRFLDPLPYKELPASLNAADLAVVALDGPSAIASLPSKTFNALACGTPILALAPADSALAELVSKHQCGYIIEPGPNASQLLTELIIHLACNPSELNNLTSNALEASRYYTPENAKLLVDAWLGSSSSS